MPSNPTRIQDLREIPDKFRKTIVGGNFLIYSYEDDEFQLTCGRVLIFGNHQNLKLLFKSETWYVDGTIQTVPYIFFQLFAIMGSVTQTHKGVERKVALPLIYALLETKAYEKVIEETLLAAQRLIIRIQNPRSIVSDFKLAIIKAI